MVTVKFDLVRCLFQSSDGDLASTFEAVGDTDRVDATIDQSFRLLQQSTGHDDHTRRTIANFVVLALGKLHKQLGDLVL